MDIISKPMKPITIRCIQKAHCNCEWHRKIRKATAKRNSRRTPYPVGFEYKREIQ